MTTLALIRHGQTDWNLEGRYQGQTDLPLNAVGLDQARALAESLAGRIFDAIYSSNLQRAQVTAQNLAERLGLALHVDPRLREVNQGKWEGMLVSEIKTRYADVWETRQTDPEKSRPPGGETIVEVSQRMCDAADDIARDWPNGTVLVVSHGMALATLLAKARGMSYADVLRLIPENVQVTEIEWRAG
jgi:probable phosphoglycerate mutase